MISLIKLIHIDYRRSTARLLLNSKTDILPEKTSYKI